MIDTIVLTLNKDLFEICYPDLFTPSAQMVLFAHDRGITAKQNFPETPKGATMVISNEVIEEVKKRLIEVYDPITIYLFGSYAWGCPTEDSDLDLLIVVDDSQEKRHNRGKPGIIALWGLGISKTIRVYTKEEFAFYITDTSSLAHLVIHKGKMLYSRATQIEISPFQFTSEPQ